MWHTKDSIQSAFVATDSASVIENMRLDSCHVQRLWGELGERSSDGAVWFFIQKENVLFGWYANHLGVWGFCAWVVFMSEPYVCKLVYDSPEPQETGLCCW